MADEYIERGDIEKWLLTETASLDGEEDRQYVVERLRNEIPTADVVAVVRCGECENWQSGWDSTSAPKGTHFCAVTGLFKPADWFCADGAKMDGGTE